MEQELKKKQIEEMARGICGLTNHCNKCFCGDSDGRCGFKMVAQRVLDLGYRKIPEGAVVLTREQYEKDLAIERELGEQKASRAHKETAEKFAEMVKAKADYMDSYSCGKRGVFISDIDEICKEITEGKDGKM